MTDLVASTIAEWLRNGSLSAIAEDAVVAAAWGELAHASSIGSILGGADDAAEEATRQIVFLGRPLAVETLRIAGHRHDLIGTARRIRADRAGYANAPSVLIIGAEEEAAQTTKLTVLRPMDGVEA